MADASPADTPVAMEASEALGVRRDRFARSLGDGCRRTRSAQKAGETSRKQGQESRGQTLAKDESALAGRGGSARRAAATAAAAAAATAATAAAAADAAAAAAAAPAATRDDETTLAKAGAVSGANARVWSEGGAVVAAEQIGVMSAFPTSPQAGGGGDSDVMSLIGALATRGLVLTKVSCAPSARSAVATALGLRAACTRFAIAQILCS